MNGYHLKERQMESNPVIYRGFEIYCAFNYTSGKSDYEVYPADGEEGWIEPYTTVDNIKISIDEKLSEA